MPRSRPRRRAWRRLLLVPVPLTLSLALAAGPVLADCPPVNTAFQPGTWSGWVGNLSTQDSDGLSMAVTDGFGHFDLVISPDGEADGAFSFQATGYADGLTDESSSASTWLIAAEASGTANTISLDGQMEWQMEGVIDVHPGEGEDPFSGDGNDLYGFDGGSTLRWSGELSPRSSSCTAVSGEMPAPVSLTASTVAWYAVKLGRGPAVTDLEARYVALMDEAESVLNMEEFDSWALGAFVNHLFQFDSLLTALESCNPGATTTVGPAWDLLQSVVNNTMYTFLKAAESGAYTTPDVVRAMTWFLQSGSLGWRGATCITPTSDDIGQGLFVRFEDLLLRRWEIAAGNDDTADMRAIAAAAVQFGLPRLLAAVGEA